MIKSEDLEALIIEHLNDVIQTEIVYQYAKYDVAIDNILGQQTLRFSDPTTFNDPFDCNEKLLKFEFSDKEIEDSLKGLKEKYSKQEIDELRRQMVTPSYQNEIFKKKKKDYKITCFSRVYDEVLMWSHYAAKHSGICIGLNLPFKYEDKFIMAPANYLNKIKTIEGNINATRTLFYWLTAKSSRWDYEKEIRAIRRTDNREEYEDVQFDAKYIKEIIFGCNNTIDDIQSAITKLKKSNLNLEKITFKRMKIDEKNFLLKEEIVKIKPDA